MAITRSTSTGSYALPVGKVSFSVENLLDKDYTTAWGQRAPGLYSPTYGAPGLYAWGPWTRVWSERTVLIPRAACGRRILLCNFEANLL